MATARKFLVSIDHTNLEAVNFKFQNLASDPVTGVGAGSAYYNSVANKFRIHNGTEFIESTDRSQHTGSQLAATISNLAATVKAYRLDEFAAPTTSLNLSSQKIINLAPGVSGTDAVNVNQLQAVVNSTDWKDSVRASTTANITLSSLQTIDGISVAAGDRVLVKNQTVASGNGLYIAATGAWTRTTDGGNGSITPSTTVMVEEGSTLAGTQWRVITTGAIVVGTTSIAWSQIGAGTSYTNGVGINVAGNVISVDSTVARKASAIIGNGSLTAIPVTHNLGSKDVSVTVVEVATDAEVNCDVVMTSTTVVTLNFAIAPATNSYRVSIIG